MKRMLFNATHPEELRLAVVDGQKLLDLDIESTSYQQKKGNIYKGRVTRVEPSLEAAFVDYGTERQGFLPLKEISRIYFSGVPENTPIGQVRIKDVIREGQEFIVQVDKEERGSKGAALTTFISLAGRYLVLMPNNPKGGGISRRIEGEERAELREAMAQLQVPDDCALIARTAGIGKSAEELQWDLDYLIHLWDAISKAAAERAAPFLIYQESNLMVRAVRDYLHSDVGDVLVDSNEVFDRIKKFMQQVSPQNLSKLKLYRDEIPLFSRFQIEHQIDSVFSHEVQLESGGALVFDRTEALVTIDVNSARATKGADIEETALNTNLEAASEIARQLRLRDIGGLIVIDFIDMTPVRNQRAVEGRLVEALRSDRARVQVGRISRFGLLEMSRQRLRPSLGESSSMACPRCGGSGHIRSIQSSALSVLRRVQEEALKENTAAVHVHLPVETATYLLNEKRFEISGIESRVGTPIVIVPTPDLETPHFRIRRLRAEELEAEGQIASYDIAYPEDVELEVPTRPLPTSVEKPVVVPIVPPVMAPVHKRSWFGAMRSTLKHLFGERKRKPAGMHRERPRRERRGRGARPQHIPARPARAPAERAPVSAPRPPREPTGAPETVASSSSDKSEFTRAHRGRRRGRRGRGQRPPTRGGVPGEGVGARGPQAAFERRERYDEAPRPEDADRPMPPAPAPEAPPEPASVAAPEPTPTPAPSWPREELAPSSPAAPTSEALAASPPREERESDLVQIETRRPSTTNEQSD